MNSREQFAAWLSRQVLDMSAPGAHPLPTKEEAEAWIEQMFGELLADPISAWLPGRHGDRRRSAGPRLQDGDRSLGS